MVPPGTKPIDAMRGNARTVYVLQGLALFCGFPAVPGLLLAYANRGAARDTWLDSHYEWQIDTFWGMFWFWLCSIAVLLVGDHFLGKGLLGHGPALLVMFGGYTWYVARLVKGWTGSDGTPSRTTDGGERMTRRGAACTSARRRAVRLLRRAASVDVWRCEACGDLSAGARAATGWTRRTLRSATAAELHSCDECDAPWPLGVPIAESGACGLPAQAGSSELPRLDHGEP